MITLDFWWVLDFYGGKILRPYRVRYKPGRVRHIVVGST